MRRWIGAMPWCSAAVALVCAAAPSSRAQETSSPPRLIDRLINLDGPGKAEKGGIYAQVGARAFGSAENRTYWQLDLGCGLSDTTALEVRGGLTHKSVFDGDGFTINHGGSDVEVLARFYSPSRPNGAFELGCAFANTPAQNRASLTAQGQWEYAFKDVTLLINPKGVLKDRPIVGIGGGIAIKIGRDLSIIGDGTALVCGRNSISPLTGDPTNQAIWGAGLRYTMAHGGQDLAVEVGATNGLGCTTGLSLTPGLGGSTAVYGSLTLRR